VRVLAISGSVRPGSTNTALLRAAAEEAPEGVEVVLWPGLKEIPPYDADDDTIPGPPAVESFKEEIRNADAILIATPEYNFSVPGVLKNAVDWASRPLATNVFRNKPVAVIGASSGMFGAVWSQAELRKILGQAMGAQIADVEVAVGRAFEKFDEQGRLVDEDVRQELRDVMAVLAGVAVPELAAA
jgi:chromate reductase, NAD(P)H dehydrogenase (quinone)